MFDFMRSFLKANKPTSHGSNALKLGQTKRIGLSEFSTNGTATAAFLEVLQGTLI